MEKSIGEMERSDVGKGRRNEEKGGRRKLPSSSLPLSSPFLSSQFECRQITASLLSPRVLAGGNMNCVLGNMSNRYTRYVYNHVYSCIGLHACVNVCVCDFVFSDRKEVLQRLLCSLAFGRKRNIKNGLLMLGRKSKAKRMCFTVYCSQHLL